MPEITVERCTKILDSREALIITFECFEDIYQAPNGRVELPRNGEKKIGTHCIAVYDYSPTERCFYFKNSWG